ncbi:hypothetical protein J3R82DRAFT_9834 [Butyriboletus roseoflavus]|nr:hypothetical protein J3R82DRAFT_9834 [Butyriboletus roseoflavus]
MPSFSSSSSIRVASQDHALRLKITHNLVHGSPSDAVHSVKGRLPKDIDVLWLSDLTISFSGSLDGHQIPAHDIARSGLVHHLQTQTQTNSVLTMCRVLLSTTQTAFPNVGHNLLSPLPIIISDPVFQVTLTPSRPLPHASRPHANLVSLHLAYIWKTVARRSDTVNSGHLLEEANPFSQTLFLPAEALLNRVTEQFLIYHFVGRYPLIFGPWCKVGPSTRHLSRRRSLFCQRLDLEMQYLPSIGHSIVEIMIRSQNQGFISKCKRLLKIARSHRKFVRQTCTVALSSYTDDAVSETSEKEIDNLPATPVLTDAEVLCESMEQLFRVGVPQRRFKPAATPQFVSLPQDDDDSLLPCIPDAGINDEAFWVELPGIATSPCALVADPCYTLQEEMDVFAEEYWPEDGMWPLRDAATSLGERELDARSDESLISASTPLASITTRSPQGYSFTHYHHLDVDYCKPPAASGLRYNASQLAYLEDSETLVLLANLTHSPSHASHDCYSEKYEQLTQKSGTCQIDAESFETLDSSSERDEVEDDLDSMLLEDEERKTPDLTCNLDWDDPVKMTEEEQKLFRLYGKLPTHKNILTKMQKDRKYFDSGDYALSKAGVAPQNTVGTAIPNPENIPHASSPPTSHQGGLSISPTNSSARESSLSQSEIDSNSKEDREYNRLTNGEDQEA